MIRDVRVFDDVWHAIRFDDATGRTEIVAADPSNTRVSGFGRPYGDSHALLYSEDGTITLAAGGQRWDLGSPRVSTQYTHDGGKTTFRVIADGQPRWEALYPAWWIEHPEMVLPGIDAPADEEQDFFGYVHSVWLSPAKRRNLANLWAV
jgi:hypothetical protein